jgi:hypothetical protein
MSITPARGKKRKEKKKKKKKKRSWQLTITFFYQSWLPGSALNHRQERSPLQRIFFYLFWRIFPNFACKSANFFLWSSRDLFAEFGSGASAFSSSFFTGVCGAAGASVTGAAVPMSSSFAKSASAAAKSNSSFLIGVAFSGVV